MISNGSMPFFAQRHHRQVDVHAHAARRRLLARRASEARRAHVFHRDNGAGLQRFKTRFDKALFGKRIADLHRRALCQIAHLMGR
jgi:hypothetical protein